MDIAVFSPTYLGAYKVRVEAKAFPNGGTTFTDYALTNPVSVVRCGYVRQQGYDNWAVLSLSSMLEGVISPMSSIIQGCLPDNPFYIRWVNDDGGYDYEMFSRNTQYEDDLTDLETIQIAARDPYNTQEAINATLFINATVGKDGLTTTEYMSIKKLMRSPLIQYYNTEQNKWHTIVLADSTSTERSTRSELHSIEFTFQLPRIKLQF